jgi:hypothetical protein
MEPASRLWQVDHFSCSSLSSMKEAEVYRALEKTTYLRHEILENTFLKCVTERRARALSLDLPRLHVGHRRSNTEK